MASIPINISTGSIETNFAFGIDLGTTNSLIAAKTNSSERAIIVQDFSTERMMPSLYYLAENGVEIVGEAAQALLSAGATEVVSSIKRYMGDKLFPHSITNSEENAALRRIEAQANKSKQGVAVPVYISSKYLSELKHRAEHALKTQVHEVVITVPAFFNEIQRQDTIAAGQLAGLKVTRLLNEPTAAALAYELDKQGFNKVAIYDFGGGTFDVSLLELESGFYEVVATNGDTRLGGDDIDEAIVSHWISVGKFDLSKISTSQLLQIARRAKETLSGNTHFEEPDSGVSLTQAELEEVSRPIIAKTIHLIDSALDHAGWRVGDVEAVVLVGGSSLMPLVQKAVCDLFGKEPLCTINPEEVVALGAAEYAIQLQSQSESTLLLDVTPLSLGIETGNGLMDILIPRNTKLPARMSKTYSTSLDGQINIKINVYQGERDLVKDNFALSSFELSGIPAMPAGLPKIEVTFSLDVNGLLTVTARELRSGIVQQVTVNADENLSDDKVEQALTQSYLHGSEDLQARQLIEHKSELISLISITNKFLVSNSEIEEMFDLSELKTKLSSLATQDLNAMSLPEIKESIEIIKILTQPLAEKLMDIAVAKALKGQQIG